MERRILLLAVVLVVAGIALTIYQDPQFKFAYDSLIGSSSSGSASTATFVSASRTTASTQLSLTYNSTAIIESLLGAGLVGIGLVFIGVAAVSSESRATRGILSELKEK